LHTAIGKHALKRRANGAWPNHPGATWVHTHDLVFLSPAGHELFDVGVLERLVKALFNVVGRSTHDGCLQFGSFHDLLSLHGPLRALGNKKPGHMNAPGFRDSCIRARKPPETMSYFFRYLRKADN
jgi:hypothetical protein